MNFKHSTSQIDSDFGNRWKSIQKKLLCIILVIEDWTNGTTMIKYSKCSCIVTPHDLFFIQYEYTMYDPTIPIF